MFHIHISIRQKSHALSFQERALLRPSRCEPPCVIDDPVARVLSKKFCKPQRPADEPCIPLPPDEPRDLPLGRDAPQRDLLDHRQDLVYHFFLHAFSSIC